MLANRTTPRSWPCKLSHYGSVAFAVCVLFAGIFQSKGSNAQDVSIEQLNATCRGQGTVRQGPDGKWYCYLSNAAIAQRKAETRQRVAEGRETCRRLARTGNVSPELRTACATLEQIHDKKEQAASESRKQKAEISKPAARDEIGQPTPGNQVLSSPAPNPAVAPTAPLPTITSATFGIRVALVIGNSNYRNVAVLPNPARDAEMVASTLREVGFQTVSLANNLSREGLIDALHSFARTAENADWALIYFAGHGVEMGGVNYLIPIDGRLEADRDVQFEAIELDQVLASVEGAKKLRLVVLDACRDNPFLKQMRRSMAARSIGRGLAAVEPESGTLVAFAAKDHEIAFDGDGPHSPFASAFVKYIGAPGLEVRRLFDFVRDDVLSATGRHQQPYTYGSLPATEDFYFVAAQPPKAASGGQ
jgi:hypothetical protein